MLQTFPHSKKKKKAQNNLINMVCGKDRGFKWQRKPKSQVISATFGEESSLSYSCEGQLGSWLETLPSSEAALLGNWVNGRVGASPVLCSRMPLFPKCHTGSQRIGCSGGVKGGSWQLSSTLSSWHMKEDLSLPSVAPEGRTMGGSHCEADFGSISNFPKTEWALASHKLLSLDAFSLRLRSCG